MGLQDFDARSVQPQQPSGGGGHPPGIWEVQVTNTFLQPSNNNEHLMLHVEFSSSVGRQVERFIVDGNSPKAIEIAQKQIAALCHVSNIYRLTYPKDANGSPIFSEAARELRGARLKIEIAPQKDKEGKDSIYMEVKKYFDIAGNEPGKSGAAPQTQPAQQSSQGQPGGWGGQPAANSAPAQQPAWGTQPAQQAQPQQNAGWSPGPQTGNNPTPPWGAGK